jgi:hypothetical protein
VPIKDQPNLGRQTQIAVKTKDGRFHVLPVGALKDRNVKPSHEQVLELLEIDIDDVESGGSIQMEDDGNPDEISFQSCVINEAQGNSNKGLGGQMTDENKEKFKEAANDWVDSELDGNNETESIIWRDMFLKGEITAEQFKEGPF